jgi:hypothetical protein
MFHAIKGTVKGPEMSCQSGAGIEVKRRPYRPGHLFHGDALTIKFVVYVMKVMHGFLIEY